VRPDLALGWQRLEQVLQRHARTTRGSRTRQAARPASERAQDFGLQPLLGGGRCQVAPDVHVLVVDDREDARQALQERRVRLDGRVGLRQRDRELMRVRKKNSKSYLKNCWEAQKSTMYGVEISLYKLTLVQLLIVS
jgi:alkanesulfonate monooxygenase SsuD/methylene tetrahydromethanopterin reductase-like flavin-dependent oxidoreductase (luciferase family)